MRNFTHLPKLNLGTDNACGFSILEVMIASGLLLVVGLGLASLLTNMGKNQRQITDYSEQRTYSIMIKSSLMNAAVFSKTKSINPTTAN